MTDFDLLCCVTAWVLDVCDTPIGDLGITTEVAMATMTAPEPDHECAGCSFDSLAPLAGRVDRYWESRRLPCPDGLGIFRWMPGDPVYVGRSR